MWQAVRKLDPRNQLRNPVMFVTMVGAAVTTALFIQALFGAGEAPASFILAVSVWLWSTVLFANFAEAVAEGRGKAQAEALRRGRQEVTARRVLSPDWRLRDEVPASALVKDDFVRVEAGQIIPADGEVVEGIASVDESAITGESAPVIRESGGDRSAVTGGTKVLSDWLIVRVTSEPGDSFLDRMIAMVEGGQAAEDTQRNCSEHSACSADDHLPPGDRQRCCRTPTMVCGWPVRARPSP